MPLREVTSEEWSEIYQEVAKVLYKHSLFWEHDSTTNQLIVHMPSMKAVRRGKERRVGLGSIKDLFLPKGE